ncbi:MAG: type II toxin-antitoxin system RelE/ParE family toxin [Pseudobdellovibrionaceae bacterium]
MGFRIEKTDLYDRWFDHQTPKFKGQIEKRLSNIKNEGHFGHAKQLTKNLAEIKFNNGSRIYFTVKEEQGKIVLLLLGGNKNGQSKDIKKAQSLLD